MYVSQTIQNQKYSRAVNVLFIRVDPPQIGDGSFGGFFLIRQKVTYLNPQCHDVHKNKILRDCNGSPNRLFWRTHVPTLLVLRVRNCLIVPKIEEGEGEVRVSGMWSEDH